MMDRLKNILWHWALLRVVLMSIPFIFLVVSIASLWVLATFLEWLNDRLPSHIKTVVK